MKKIFIALLILFIPVVVLEVILHVHDDLYRKIILYNSDFSDWQQAAPIMNYWPETIILGNSIAKQDINPEIVEKQLLRNGIKTRVGNIAANAESTSSDYIMLKRILATCKRCPKRIIYQITESALKKSEIKEMKDTTLRRMLRLYYPDPEIDNALKKASNLDPYFNEYYLDVRLYSSFRTFFTKGRLVSLLTNEFFKKSGISNQDLYEPNYSDQEMRNGLNGFYSYPNVMDEKTKNSSLKHEEMIFRDFQIGGATEFFFLETLNLAKKEKMKVYLVLTPDNALLHKSFPVQARTFRSYVGKQAKEHTIPLIDDREYLSKRNELFYDLKHLNRRGSSIYSLHLGDRLSKVWEQR